MGRAKVLFIADSLDNAHRFHQVLSGMDVEVHAGSSLQMARLLAACADCKLVIFEVRSEAVRDLGSVEQMLVDAGGVPLLAIVRKEALAAWRAPASVKSDFVVSGADAAECEARIRNLLAQAGEAPAGEVIAVDSMTINLATYQVQVAGEPIDFTYLEYALLAFLVTHAGRTYGRDALLRRVWGFDYYGGSRTVDVHVRRVRAKLGPDLAQHLETVRGVGYLWQ